jgi:hypothetical protein
LAEQEVDLAAGIRRVSALLSGREFLDWTQLDCAERRARTACSGFNCLVDVRDVKQVVASKLFLRLGEGSVCYDGLTIGGADRRRRGGRLQRIASQ